jgi:hypothetical protein
MGVPIADSPKTKGGTCSIVCATVVYCVTAGKKGLVASRSMTAGTTDGC